MHTGCFSPTGSSDSLKATMDKGNRTLSREARPAWLQWQKRRARSEARAVLSPPHLAAALLQQHRLCRGHAAAACEAVGERHLPRAGECASGGPSNVM